MEYNFVDRFFALKILFVLIVLLTFSNITFAMSLAAPEIKSWEEKSDHLSVTLFNPTSKTVFNSYALGCSESYFWVSNDKSFLNRRKSKELVYYTDVSLEPNDTKVLMIKKDFLKNIPCESFSIKGVEG